MSEGWYAAIRHDGTGTLNINGGTYIGGKQGIATNTSTIHIKNANITSKNHGIVNHSGGTIRICNSNIKGIIDLQNTGSGKIGNIYYSSNVIFTSGNNIPTRGGVIENIQLSEEAC